MHIVMVLLLVFICGCNTPYTGDLGPEDFNGWIESEDVNFVCLFNGFDRICIKTIRGHKGDQGIQGPAGKDGRDGIDGIDGIDGRDGMDGIDGAVIYLLLEKIVVETVFVEVPVFVLAVSKTETTYTTPVGEVYVPEDAPIIVPSDVIATPMTVDPTPIAPPMVTVPTVIAPNNPEPNPDPAQDDEIWHVAYSVNNGVVEAYAYPRCFNDKYTAGKVDKCTLDDDISEDEYFEETLDLKNEIQGTREYVNEQLDKVLDDNDASLGHVGGIQGIVN